MLPLRCLNGKGWVVQPPKGKWLPLQGVDRNSQMVSAQLALKPTGEVLGSMEESYLGVPALQMRSKIKEKGQDTYVKSYANAGADWVRQDVKLINMEKPEETFKTQYQLSRAGAPQPEELLYLSPMLLHGQQENPFKLASRQYPVDFGSPVDETYVMNYELPPGYVIEELPKATVFSLPGNAAKFSYVVQEVNGKLQVMSKLTIHKTVFTASDYQNLREFYARMVAKHAEKVVLRKKS
ncbi:hypothetical protein [Rufibacter ruber]|uniref:hypothetical protein n=1 Tax=Rufibacter ruber TaxID=1783499 RepID=UPI0008320F76|nr:hypothetical protein [Rufibacter ruber]